jgi:8-oxo-dGTP pyrophosphatase MutT (NUDIX family)
VAAALLSDGVVELRPESEEGSFSVEHEGRPVGRVTLRRIGSAEGELSWSLHDDQRGRGYATRAVRLLVTHALEDLGLTRVQARVAVGNDRAMRVATRSGLMREGVRRQGATHEPDAAVVVLARLSSDPPISEPGAFRALLNSFLPRKRAIAQMLVRDRDGRVLLCRLTYKQDWDLPGGVVEVGESPQQAVSREVEEELGLRVAGGGLLLTDWLPPWSGWDDALCLVFDGGVQDASVISDAVLQPREIRAVQFCTPEEVRQHCADFTARRIEAALANLDGAGAPYTESGRS